MKVRSILPALVAGVASVASVAANAALPAAIGTALTAVQTDTLAIFDLGWPVFAAIAGGFVLFKIAKKVLGKVT